MKQLNFTDPQGRTLTVNSPDNSIPTEAELDRMFSIKYGQPSVSSQGLSYVKEHPFKTALQPLAQTLTGKSFQERALEATVPKELPVRQIGRTAIGPTERDFTGQFLKQALAGMAGSAADIATTPASYVPIPGAQLAGKIPVGSTTVGRIAKNVAVRPGFVKGVGELQRLESALRQSGRLSSRGIPVTAAPLDVRSTNTIWGLYNEIAGTKFKKVSDVTQAKPQRVTAMRTISENLNNVKLSNPQTGEIETRVPATRLELLDAFRQTKTSVWQKVNQLSSGATEKQAQIDLPRLAQQALQKTKGDIGDVALTTDKTLLTALEETVSRIRKSGVISPTQSESYMKFLNNEIQRLRNSGQAVDFSVKDLYSNLLHGLNEATDQAIESALGTSGYRTFRYQYASLKSAEKELLGAANSFIKQTSGRSGGVTHPIANLWALEEFLKGAGQIAMGNVAGGVKSIGQGALAKTSVRMLDYFKNPDRKISEIFQAISKAKTLPIKETFAPTQTHVIFPFPEGPGSIRQPRQEPPQLPYTPQRQLPFLGRAPYKPTGYPGGAPPQKPLITPYQPGGQTIRGQAPYQGTTLPALSPQPPTQRPPINLEKLRKSLQGKTQGHPLRGRHEVIPKEIIELPPRQSPQGKPGIVEGQPLTTAEAVKQGMGEFVDAKIPITQRTVTSMDKGTPRIYSKQIGGEWTENITGAKITDSDFIKSLNIEGEKQFQPVSKIVSGLFQKENAWVKDGGHLSNPQKQVLNKMKDMGLVEKVTIPNPYKKGAEDYTVWKLTSKLLSEYEAAKGAERQQEVYSLSMNNLGKKIPENYDKLVIPEIEKALQDVQGDVLKNKVYNYIVYYANKGKSEGILDSVYVQSSEGTKRVYYKIGDKKITVKLIKEVEQSKLLSEYEAAKGAQGQAPRQNPLRNKSGQAFIGGEQESYLKTVADVENLILTKSKQYGSKNNFLASEEYKKLYPQVERIYTENKNNFVSSANKALEENNIKIGDRVSTLAQGFSGGESVSGTVISKGGIPYVKLDSPQMTQRGYKKQVQWHKGWKKAQNPSSGGSLGILGPTMATGIGLATALRATAAKAEGERRKNLNRR